MHFYGYHLSAWNGGFQNIRPRNPTDSPYPHGRQKGTTVEIAYDVVLTHDDNEFPSGDALTSGKTGGPSTVLQQQGLRLADTWIFSEARDMKYELKDKWILITGASSGFGAAAALAFATEGSKLLLGA